MAQESVQRGRVSGNGGLRVRDLVVYLGEVLRLAEDKFKRHRLLRQQVLRDVEDLMRALGCKRLVLDGGLQFRLVPGNPDEDCLSVVGSIESCRRLVVKANGRFDKASIEELKLLSSVLRNMLMLNSYVKRARGLENYMDPKDLELLELAKEKLQEFKESFCR